MQADAIGHKLEHGPWSADIRRLRLAAEAALADMCGDLPDGSLASTDVGRTLKHNTIRHVAALFLANADSFVRHNSAESAELKPWIGRMYSLSSTSGAAGMSPDRLMADADAAYCRGDKHTALRLWRFVLHSCQSAQERAGSINAMFLRDCLEMARRLPVRLPSLPPLLTATACTCCCMLRARKGVSIRSVLTILCAYSTDVVGIPEVPMC